MPDPSQSIEAFPDFVTLSQLVSPSASIADTDTFDIDQVMDHTKPHLALQPPALARESPRMANNNLWIMGQQMPNTPDLTGSYTASSASNSPSSQHPHYISVQQEQNHKRRAQNRAAQRAYRDRKMRHLVDLESGIREIEEKIRQLQTENTGLIRELCEVRAENREWKESRSQGHAHPGCCANQSHQPRPSFQGRSASSSSRRGVDKQAEGAGSLYEPFAAMWNLIRLDPSVAKGNVGAATVLERLKMRAEKESGLEGGGSRLNSISESEAG